MKKRAKRTLITVGGLVGLYVLHAIGFLDSLFSHLSSSPWWVYFVVAGILFSGYRFIADRREDQQADEEWIEDQGKVYMKRIEEARKRRTS